MIVEALLQRIGIQRPPVPPRQFRNWAQVAESVHEECGLNVELAWRVVAELQREQIRLERCWPRAVVLARRWRDA